MDIQNKIITCGECNDIAKSNVFDIGESNRCPFFQEIAIFGKDYLTINGLYSLKQLVKINDVSKKQELNELGYMFYFNGLLPYGPKNNLSYTPVEVPFTFYLDESNNQQMFWNAPIPTINLISLKIVFPSKANKKLTLLWMWGGAYSEEITLDENGIYNFIIPNTDTIYEYKNYYGTANTGKIILMDNEGFYIQNIFNTDTISLPIPPKYLKPITSLVEGTVQSNANNKDVIYYAIDANDMLIVTRSSKGEESQSFSENEFPITVIDSLPDYGTYVNRGQILGTVLNYYID